MLAAGKAGTEHKESRHRPRVDVKHVNSKLAFLSLTKPAEPDADDLIPEDSEDRKPDPEYVLAGTLPRPEDARLRVDWIRSQSRERMQGVRG